MWFRNGCLALSLCGALAAGTIGCGDASEPDQEPVGTERQALSQNIPWWLVEMPADWGCGQTLEGRFQGWDSAHMYAFPGKIGYRYDFQFKGSHPARKGVVMAVYDSETGQLVASDYEVWGNEIGLVYEAEKSIPYYVGVYSIAWHATGDYTLTAECELTKHCVEWETSEPDGTPLNNFYAQEVVTYDEGKQVLAQIPHFFHEAINPGRCSEQGLMCPAVVDPVCTDSPEPQTQYNNLCEFKRHVREMASQHGQWKGHWENDVCDATGQFCGGIAGLPCPDGFTCVLEGSYPDAGGSCQPVSCTYAGKQYAPGDSFPATDGCNTCTCTDDGHIACTEIYCQCDPEKEWWRDYKFTDPDTCAVVKYQCQPKTLPFSNDCGCGCQQDPACPEWINCMPPVTPECTQLQTDCPYSQVAY